MSGSGIAPMFCEKNTTPSRSVAKSLGRGGLRPTSTQKNHRPGVTFDKITIREYSRCLGYNPDVVDGPPLSLDWSYTLIGTFQVDEYEKNRSIRLIGAEMVLSGKERHDILLDHTNALRDQFKSAARHMGAARLRFKLGFAHLDLELCHGVFGNLMRKSKQFRPSELKRRGFETIMKTVRTMKERNSVSQLDLDDCSTEDSSNDDFSLEEEKEGRDSLPYVPVPVYSC